MIVRHGVVRRTAGRRAGPAARAARWAQLATLGAASCLLLTACGGSAMNARDVALANREAAGQVATSATPGSPAVDPSTGSVIDPGTGQQVSTDAPSTSTGVTQVLGPDPGRTHTSTGGADKGRAGAPGPGSSAGSCTGFRNQTGISDSTITLANVADISGPVPGIFSSAQLAAKAYVQYFNSTARICGRTLTLLP
ncbi:MAG: hypothetical protein ACJ72E_03320, partial [Marmoricola sp.]